MDYVIKNGLLEASFNLKGAELKSLIYNGNEYMLNDEKYWGYTSPLLFPVIGKLVNGFTIIDGIKYEIPKHGIMRNAKFELLNKTDNEIKFIFKSNKETLKVYPYKFDLILTYKLEDKKLLSKIEVVNNDIKPMYFNLGLHPAFILKDNFESYKIEFEKSENTMLPTVESNGTINFEKIDRELKVEKYMPLKYEDYKVDAVILRNCESRNVSLLNENNKGIKFNFEGFNTVAFWTPNNLNSPFICIEPWIGYASKTQDSDEFLEKDYLIELKENKKTELNYYFELID